MHYGQIMPTNMYSAETVELYKPKFRKIDVLNGKEFQAGLDACLRKNTRLVVDLGDVSFIDSSGLGKLVAAIRACREGGGAMRICSVQSSVMTLFDLVHLTDIVAIDADSEAAISALSNEDARDGS